MKWVMILSNDSIKQDDFIKTVKIESKKYCIIKNDGRFYATQSRCPHAGADLSAGWCKNGKLICSFHRYQYDLTTGEGAEGQGDYLETYPLEVRDDGIYIGIEEKWKLLRKIFRF
ncbi:MAG TPA: Rieske (2Fe-2S) protein [Sphingobacteriaceae bacterium]|nr:Rieske (2Fe-2S) protein [Sphingobacteriaceae bacterium]